MLVHNPILKSQAKNSKNLESYINVKVAITTPVCAFQHTNKCTHNGWITDTVIPLPSTLPSSHLSKPRHTNWLEHKKKNITTIVSDNSSKCNIPECGQGNPTSRTVWRQVRSCWTRLESSLHISSQSVSQYPHQCLKYYAFLSSKQKAYI